MESISKLNDKCDCVNLHFGNVINYKCGWKSDCMCLYHMHRWEPFGANRSKKKVLLLGCTFIRVGLQSGAKETSNIFAISNSELIHV